MRRVSTPYARSRAFTPVQIEQRELSERVEGIAPRSGPDGGAYQAARVLVRLHSLPAGVVDLSLPAGGVPAAELTAAIEAQLGPVLVAHLAGDGLRAPGDEAPLPPCLAERRAVLARAPAASVVIPTRARPGPLRRCLDSVLACDYPRERLELIVADNAPPDGGTRELIEGSYAGRVAYVLAPRPGSGSARNDGAARARGEIVAFVDDDAVVDRHWLAELATGFEARGGPVSCVTGLVFAAELDTRAQQLFEEYGGFGKGFAETVYDLGEHRPAHAMFPFNPGIVGSGNNVAFRREELRELGGYDPCLGNGTPARSGEDWELFLRLLRAGRRIAYRPGAIVHHSHRRELAALEDQLRDYGVGLSAALTRTVVHDPRAGLDILRRLPAAAHYLLSARSAKNRNRGAGYPPALRRAELAGLACGPAAYVRSRLTRAG